MRKTSRFKNYLALFLAGTMILQQSEFITLAEETVLEQAEEAAEQDDSAPDAEEKQPEAVTVEEEPAPEPEAERCLGDARPPREEAPSRRTGDLWRRKP